jgi:DNA polymerase elongation subunit (family B)
MINDLIVKYSAKINKDIKKTCRLLWDALKVKIREITMTFSKLKVKETRELARTLEKTLEDKLAYSDTAVIYNAMLNNEIYKLEKEMEQIYEQKAKDAQIRSRKKWVEYGENTMLIY